MPNKVLIIFFGLNIPLNLFINILSSKILLLPQNNINNGENNNLPSLEQIEKVISTE